MNGKQHIALSAIALLLLFIASVILLWLDIATVWNCIASQPVHDLPQAAIEGGTGTQSQIGGGGIVLSEEYLIKLQDRQTYRTKVYRSWSEFPESSRRNIDVLIVGAGLSAAVVAERAASAGLRVLVVEKRAHIGGNCFDFTLPGTGIRMCKYGSHLFHTKSDRVWDYVQRFSEWRRWEHEKRAYVAGQLVPLPVNPTTVNMLTNTSISTEAEMQAWLDSHGANGVAQPNNSADIGIQRVGGLLFELLFRHYTKKQWDREPRDLRPSVLGRIPVHTNHDTRYFRDRYQALPAHGYTAWIDRMFLHPLIEVVINTDFFDVDASIERRQTVFTGPVDRYFAQKGLPSLAYRSLVFENVLFTNAMFFQQFPVINFPGPDVAYTRIVEHKHFLRQSSPHTVLSVEFPSATGEPYYPIPDPANEQLYERYKALAQQTPAVHFVGRLATYKYYDMDQAIEQALIWFDEFLNKTGLAAQER